ncbi:CYFA0S10e00276g1_1 [Cyberlindnera fabianii]|uniref:Mediator of RNA polymerase II transcription subunit 8 n=1 Tax=Cyberlindnera fabianii TaxID=36022 RepID=A0A061B4P2_CYBFA|nr:CYFA0S10e00276g1_1 [Cyberlindnera fabianii]
MLRKAKLSININPNKPYTPTNDTHTTKPMQSPVENKEPPADHSGVPVEALEALRLRLTQLTHTLSKLQAEFKNPQLTHYVSLQTQFNIVLTQLASLLGTLSEYSNVLESTVAFPLPQFPTTEQEGLLTTLLRKKAAPEVVEWIEESKAKSTDILLRDDEGLTKWAVETMQRGKQNHNFTGYHTKEELDNGALDEKEDVKMEEDEKIRYTVDQTLKFMYQGDIPRV